MVKVLLVEDLPRGNSGLADFLAADPDILVVGTTDDHEQAIHAIARSRPDLVVLDLNPALPTGVEVTRRIMENHPLPVVMISGGNLPDEVSANLQALAAGALMVLCRPRARGHPDHGASVREMLNTLKLMAEVKVVRRRPRRRSKAKAPVPLGYSQSNPAPARIVALGASTGGPLVLHRILSLLSADFPVPIVIVQHIASGFAHGFAQWLAQSSPLRVAVGAEGDRLRPGRVYIAPDDHQMRVVRGGRISLSLERGENGLRPSIACLFRSVAEVYAGGVIAGLLTGMGRDGATELKLLRDCGAVTFAQDEDSSVVYGMAGAAVALEAVQLTLPAERIAAMLTELANPVKEFVHDARPPKL